MGCPKLIYKPELRIYSSKKLRGRNGMYIYNYRYGFNGKETDNETGTQDYGMRIYNPALAKFLSLDPLMKSFAMLTPYQFASNRPIDGIDLEGKEWKSEHSWGDAITDQNHIKILTDLKILKAGETITYEQAYSAMSPKILSDGLKKPGTVLDCADACFYQLIDYASKFSLPIHLEKTNTNGEPMVIDNDVVEKGKNETVDQLKKNVGENFGSFHIYDKEKELPFTTPIDFENLKPGDMVIWADPKPHHAATVTGLTGGVKMTVGKGLSYEPRKIQFIEGNQYFNKLTEKYVATPLKSVTKDYEATKAGKNSAGGQEMTKAKRWNFAYFDKKK